MSAEPLKMRCPHCGRLVKVIDPYRDCEIQRASAWFDRHMDTLGEVCIGSQSTAIAREPRPISQEQEREKAATSRGN